MTGRIMEMRDAFFEALFLLAQDDPRIMIVSNDLGARGLDRFRDSLPGRFINAGVSEQNIISAAAGLAMAGKRVCVYSIASFISLRCLEQIKLDLCVMNLPVTIAAMGPGWAYTTDGPTHHATEDVAVLGGLANLCILSPCDAAAAAAMAVVVKTGSGPAYLRLDRGIMPAVYRAGASFDEGYAVLRTGADVCLVATGIMTHTASAAAETLDRRGVQAGVIDVYRLKPLPAPGLLRAAAASSRIVTIEEHALHGGLGSIMLEACADAGVRQPLLRLGIGDDRLYAYGGRGELQAAAGLDRDAVVRRIIEWH